MQKTMRPSRTRNTFILVSVACLLLRAGAAAGLAEKERWYENPLGFSPLNLHAFNGFLVPALAVGACLLLTKADPALADRFAFFSEGGVSWGYKYPRTTLYQGNAGVLYFARKWLSVGAELGLYVPHDEFNSTAGIAIRPFARFYPVNTASFRLYFESGAGVIAFFRKFPQPTGLDPRLGTNLNGNPRYGLGFEVNLGPRTALLFGALHVHVSNANLWGVGRNPSHDSNGFFVGLTYRPAGRLSGLPKRAPSSCR